MSAKQRSQHRDGPVGPGAQQRVLKVAGADVEFGLRFAELHALLWMRAGGIGERQVVDRSKPLAIAAAAPYA